MDQQFDAAGFLATLSQRPGCYRMLDADGEILYVGKARNLKKRVATYFGSKAHHPKTQALMNHTARVEVTVTATEQEALLLEYNLIKAHRPRFNVLLRDDKSYPYIRVTTSQTFPRFEFHRGARRPGARYFGPYPSAGAVRETLGQLQRLFQVRQCRDSYFANRSRPCLQYQIKRCTAPCVGFIDAAGYRRDVDNAMRFLSGRNDAVLADLQARMDDASAALRFEAAAQYRDQIRTIRDIQAKQFITGARAKDVDILAAVRDGGIYCVASIMIRGGRMLGGRNFFPRSAAGTEPGEVLAAFIMQHYFVHAPPPDIIVNAAADDAEVLELALGEHSGHRVRIRDQVRGTRRRWRELAETNARQALQTHRAAGATLSTQRESLRELLGMDEAPARIECFDISHTGGEKTVASCVVFGPEGPAKSAYRRFNITGIEAGDDYAAIGQAVARRYRRLIDNDAPLPDLVLIDGGRGQLDRATEALEELGLGALTVIGVAKGTGRRAGRERLYRPGSETPLRLPPDAPGLHLIQQARDEAHRFAITAHRQRRNKSRRESTLESIPGLGPNRRKALLRQFGGLQGVRQSGIDDLAKVRGISRTLAERIYEHLH